MPGWLIFLYVLLFLGIIMIFVTAVLLGMYNTNKNNSMKYTTFSSIVPIATSDTLNTPVTMSCPAGTEINVGAAIVEVYNPYSQCTSDPATVYQAMCNSEGDTLNAFCDNAGGTAPWTNTMCGPGGQGQCAILNLTGFLGQQANGQQSWTGASVTDFVTSSNGDTWTPCPGIQGSNLDSYSAELPVSPGNVGDLSLPNPVPSTTNQGYYVHGFYSCIPTSE